MKPEQNKSQVIYTLWGALLMSHCIFIYVTLNFVHVESVVGPNSTMMTILSAMAFVVAIVSFVVNRKALAQKTLDQFFVSFILSCALAESVHIFGVVGTTMAMPLNYYFSFAASGIALHLFYFPRNLPKE